MVAPVSGRYEVVCRLAGGGMADLYLARATGLAGFERLVVIKRLAEIHGNDPEMVQALYDEARIAAALSHANVVQVNDVEVVDGKVSIVMEFLHGQDTSQLLRRLRRMGERLPLDQALAIALCVCAGLHHAHERVGPGGRSLDIVHRDVSPHNVFVTYDGAVKVVDFGIARAASRRNKTQVGVIKGKPGYISPEMLRGKRVDRRTDVWGAGVLLYELTTGVAPYRDGTGMEALVAVITDDPPPPSTHVPGYPPELAAIVARAMAREASGRYKTCDEMRAELEAYARSQRLDLSPFGMAALMERLFSPQLAAWRTAQKQGQSLADYVRSGRASRSHDAIGAESLLPAPAPAIVRRSSLRSSVDPEAEATMIDPNAGSEWPELGPAMSDVVEVPHEAIAAAGVSTFPGLGVTPAAVAPAERSDALRTMIPTGTSQPAFSFPTSTDTVSGPRASVRWPVIVGAAITAPLVIIAIVVAYRAITREAPAANVPMRANTDEPSAKPEEKTDDANRDAKPNGGESRMSGDKKPNADEPVPEHEAIRRGERVALPAQVSPTPATQPSPRPSVTDTRREPAPKPPVTDAKREPKPPVIDTKREPRPPVTKREATQIPPVTDTKAPPKTTPRKEDPNDLDSALP